MEPQRAFIPAAGHDWLLPLYDPLLRWIGREHAIKGLLIAQAELSAGQRVLDLGSGTGTLAVRLARELPGLEVHGVDPDPRALDLSVRKARRAGVQVRFTRAFADDLPYPDAHFDRVLSSLMLHHLSDAEKRGACRELRRVLAPGGSVHLMDFGPSSHGHPHRGFVARRLHPDDTLDGNLQAHIPEVLREAGFADARQVADRGSLFGTLAYYRASP